MTQKRREFSNPIPTIPFVRSIDREEWKKVFVLDATRTRCCSFKQRSPLWVAKETRSSGSTRIKEPLSSREEEFLDASSWHWDKGDKIWGKPGCVPVSMITRIFFFLFCEPRFSEFWKQADKQFFKCWNFEQERNKRVTFILD